MEAYRIDRFDTVEAAEREIGAGHYHRGKALAGRRGAPRQARDPRIRAWRAVVRFAVAAGAQSWNRDHFTGGSSSVGRLKTDDAAQRRRAADRTTGIGAERAGDKTGDNRRGSPVD